MGTEKSEELDSSTFSGNKFLKKNLLPVILAAILDKAVFFPLDTVIIHKQDTDISTRQVVRQLWHEGGIKKFYPAFKISMATVIPLRLSVFSLYELIKEQGDSTRYGILPIMLYASIMSGFAETVLFCPLDAYRTRKTLRETSHLKFDPRLIYKGFSPLFMRNSIENTICLVGSDLFLTASPEWFAKSKIAPYLTAFTSGCFSQLFATPFDVIKTHRMKNPEAGLIANISSLVKTQGLFRSTWLKAARAGACNAMMIGTTKMIIRHTEESEATQHKSQLS